MKLILTIALASTTQATIHRGKIVIIIDLIIDHYRFEFIAIILPKEIFEIFLKHRDKLKTMMVTSRQQSLPEDRCSICQDTNKDSLLQICQM